MSFADLTSAALEFVRQHPNWAAGLVFLLAFGESLPFASLFLPFWAILVAIGTIVGAAAPFTFGPLSWQQQLEPRLGIGYRTGWAITTKATGAAWSLSKYPRLLEKGRALFRTWGAGAIFLARFSGPLRATVPIVAGIAAMPPLRFQLANWLSAFFWAFVLLSPGMWGLGWLLNWSK